jgi:DNA-binding transcriptional ArsR family regulator
MDAEDGHADDVRVLRAIAHPVRNRVLDELGATGPLRAADVAERIGIPANQASFHLRQLAKYGLVEEAPELARDGRDRVWRLVHEEGTKLRLDLLEKEPGNRAAVGVFRRNLSERAKAFVDLAFRGGQEQEQDTTVTVISDALALTKAEARAYSEELTALNERWRQQTQAEQTQAEQEGRRTYHVLQIVQPYPKQAD